MWNPKTIAPSEILQYLWWILSKQQDSIPKMTYMDHMTDKYLSIISHLMCSFLSWLQFQKNSPCNLNFTLKMVGLIYWEKSHLSPSIPFSVSPCVCAIMWVMWVYIYLYIYVYISTGVKAHVNACQYTCESPRLM